MTDDNPLPPPSSEPTPIPPHAPPPPVPLTPYVAPAPGASDGAFAPPAAYAGPVPGQDDRTMAMLCHLLTVVSGFVGPLIIWLIKKDQSPFVDDQGKEALNFQITLLIAYVIGGVTACLFIGYLVILATWVCGIVFGILGGLEANKGRAYRYPFAVRLVK